MIAGRRLVGAQPVVLSGVGHRRAQQRLVGVHRLEHRRAEEQERQVLVRRLARVQQVLRRRADRPVVVLARAVDPGERLLVQEADQPVVAGHVLHHLHRQLLVVGADVGALVDRRQLELVGRDLVVTGLDRHAQALELALGLHHEREDPLGDRAEVVVVELLALGRLGAEQGAAGVHQVGTLVVVLLVDQEVLLLGADAGVDVVGLVAQQRQRLDRRLRQRVHGAQQRDLLVQRLAGPRHERRGDAQQRPVGVLQDERGRGRVPGGVAAGLEGRAQAAGGERGGVRLGLDQVLALELGDRRAVGLGIEEGVVLLGGGAGERLEPVRVVRGALLQRPLQHRVGDLVGEVDVEALAAGHGGLQALEGVLGEAVLLDRGGEDVLAVVVDRLGQVGRAQTAVRRPLGCGDVLLTGPRGGHG